MHQLTTQCSHPIVNPILCELQRQGTQRELLLLLLAMLRSGHEGYPDVKQGDTSASIPRNHLGIYYSTILAFPRGYRFRSF